MKSNDTQVALILSRIALRKAALDASTPEQERIVKAALKAIRKVEKK